MANPTTVNRLPQLTDYLSIHDLDKIKTILNMILTKDPNVKYYEEDSNDIIKAINQYLEDFAKHISDPS